MSGLTVTHVNTSRDAPIREGNYLKCSEIRLPEGIDLEIRAPWQILNQVWSIIDQPLVFGAHLLVNDGNETWMITIILTRTEGKRTYLPSHSARLPYGST